MTQFDKNQDKGDRNDGAHLITVTLIINGTPERVRINENAPLKTLVQKALTESGNEGRKEQDWQLKLGAQVLDLDKKLANYGIQDGAELFLSLKAGHGG